MNDYSPEITSESDIGDAEALEDFPRAVITAGPIPRRGRPRVRGGAHQGRGLRTRGGSVLGSQSRLALISSPKPVAANLIGNILFSLQLIHLSLNFAPLPRSDSTKLAQNLAQTYKICFFTIPVISRQRFKKSKI